jgi:excisionase family DNA binding protein
VAKNPKKAPSYSAVYTLVEFAKIFKLSLQSVRALIRTGEIPAIRIGKQHRIPQTVVDHYFAQATSPTERGFGMWKKNRVQSLPYVNKLRNRKQRKQGAWSAEHGAALCP